MLELIQTNLPLLLHGLLTTLLLLAITVVLGVCCSLACAVIRYYRVPVLASLLGAVIFVIRGTPFLVQLFIIYYGPLQFNWIRHSFLSVAFKSAYFCAILALVINTTAYTTEMFYGGMKHLPKSEILTAKALGLHQRTIFFAIILPRFFQNIFPIYINEVIMILKCTALVSAITVLDVMGSIQQIMTQTYQVIPSLLLAGMLYLILAFSLTSVLKIMYRRLGLEQKQPHQAL